MKNGNITIKLPYPLRMHVSADVQFHVLSFDCDVINGRIYGININSIDGPYIEFEGGEHGEAIRAQFDVLLQTFGIDLPVLEWSGDSADYDFDEDDFTPGEQLYVFEMARIEKMPNGEYANIITSDNHKAAIAAFVSAPYATVYES